MRQLILDTTYNSCANSKCWHSVWGSMTSLQEWDKGCCLCDLVVYHVMLLLLVFACLTTKQLKHYLVNNKVKKAGFHHDV